MILLIANDLFLNSRFKQHPHQYYPGDRGGITKGGSNAPARLYYVVW
jgi:hypothetical protein